MIPKVKKILITTESHEVYIFRRQGRKTAPDADAEAVYDVPEGDALAGALPCVGEQHSAGQAQTWNLTAEAFERLLRHIDADPERAGEKYLFLRKNLVRFFEGRGFYEAEDASDEVVNRLARKLDSGHAIENISQYAFGVARLVALELFKRRAREQKALCELPVPETADPEADGNEARLAALNSCLADLEPESRDLILAYYSGEGGEKIRNRQALAAKLGIPQNALRSRAVRLRDKLKLLLDKHSSKQGI